MNATLRLPLCLLFVLIVLHLGVHAEAPTSSPVAIDFTEGTINGRSIVGMTVDNATQILGRPSEVAPKHIMNFGSSQSKFGPTLWYFDKGLSLEFDYAEPDSDQKCRQVTVFLTESSIKAGTFQPFKGTINKGVNRDWKVDQL